MIKSDAKLKKLAEAFRLNNRKMITAAIEMLRDEQPFEGAVGLLAGLYDRTNEQEIMKAVENFLNDIKDQSVAKEVIKEIRHGWKPATTKMLVSSCWQSGLDYSSFSTEITDVFLDSDYATAIECLTVLGESVHSLSNRKKKELLTLIESRSQTLDKDMIKLALELKEIVQAG